MSPEILIKILKDLPNDLNVKIVFAGRKPNSCFNIKDQTKFEHQNDIVYLGNCFDSFCSYIDKTSRPLSEQIIGNNIRDNKLHLFIDVDECDYKNVDQQDFKVIEKGCRNCVLKQNISEALFLLKTDTYFEWARKTNRVKTV